MAIAADPEPAPAAGKNDSSFLFVPYPITEPTLGAGVLAGPVWMRPGPREDDGPGKPQAFGAGALWTDEGSRGAVAFDHRAWADGRWRTSALLGRADLRLHYDGIVPTNERGVGFAIRIEGASVSGERRLGSGPDSLGIRMFASTAEVDFTGEVPPERQQDPATASVNGLALSWTRDTRDEIYTPSSGHWIDVTATAYVSALGASFDAQSAAMKWTRYQPAGRGVIGTRVVAQAAFGDAPFYLRPYVSFRGVPALRYAGERVATVEAEYRFPITPAWHVLAFAGAGHARVDRQGIRDSHSVSAQGVGVRFKSRKYFGLTFGFDVAEGPDGVVTYIQVGNVWSR